MKKEFTTFDIVKIMKINRNSLQTWLDGHFIKPSIQEATRRGTKNLFAREDLYQIQLFIDLLNAGFNRETAKKIAAIDFKNIGPRKEQKKYGVISIEKPTPGKALLIGFSFTQEPRTVPLDDKNRYCIVINLLAVKKEVDSLIG